MSSALVPVRLSNEIDHTKEDPFVVEGGASCLIIIAIIIIPNASSWLFLLWKETKNGVHSNTSIGLCRSQISYFITHFFFVEEEEDKIHALSIDFALSVKK